MEKLPVEAQKIIRFYSDLNKIPEKTGCPDDNGYAFSIDMYIKMMIELGPFMENNYSPFAFGLNDRWVGMKTLEEERVMLKEVREYKISMMEDRLRKRYI